MIHRLIPKHLAAVTLLGVAVVALGACGSTSGATNPGSGPSSGPICAPPSPSGTVVHVSLVDQGGGMGGGGMMGGGSNGAGSMGSGMGSMALLATPSEVKAGDVTFVAANVGSIIHELIVLPMPSGVAVAGLPVGADDKVSESGSLGEASKPCGAGAGAGIGPGKAGWVSVHLTTGQYDLVCNEPGHYRSGMYLQLTVT